MSDIIQVFIGTKAQYIKTAPLLRLMDECKTPYRLIDSGQHAEIAEVMRRELGIRAPDVVMGGSRDIDTIRGALIWSMKIASKLWSRKRLRRDVFGGRGGICVVHGDTPSTLLSSVLAWRAGLRVAHLEAGLRSRSLWHPFPEELIRIFVMRFADILFAPTPDAVENLENIRHRGQVIALDGNTSIEAVAFAGTSESAEIGPVVVTMHRVENLRSKDRVEAFVTLVERIARDHPVRFVVHGPTELVLKNGDGFDRLRAAGVDIGSLVGHAEFVAMLSAAPFVVIDGGSIQEECAYLGVPTLLWREKTERPHGLGSNVVLSAFDPSIVDSFLADTEAHRRERSLPESRPSETIHEILLEALEEVDRS